MTNDTGRDLGPYRQEISLGKNINWSMMVYRRIHLPHGSKTTGVDEGESQVESCL